VVQQYIPEGAAFAVSNSVLRQAICALHPHFDSTE